jgi:sterol desaturase/sphingolipid hydroxylase (fatty acid hydroxylase superfamily)
LPAREGGSIIRDLLQWLKGVYGPMLWQWGAIALSMVVIHCLELVFPAKPNQYRSVGFNVLVIGMTLGLSPLVGFLPGYVVASAVQAAGGPWIAINLADFVADRGEVLRIVTLSICGFVPLFVFDFFFYWHHRLQHANSWLWEQHKLHHTDDAFNVTTSVRHHWTEDFLRGVLTGVPLGVLFNITPVDAGLVTMFTAYWSYLTHANIRLPLGPLSPFLLGPQVHRIHHSVLPEHQNHNFAAFFPIWDVLFRTFYYPRWDEFPDTGLVGEPARPSMANVLFAPFIAWEKMLAARMYLSIKPGRCVEEQSWDGGDDKPIVAAPR